MKREIPVLVLALSLAARASAVDLHASFWLPAPEGSLAVGANGHAGTEVDLEDDLGYGDAESVGGFDGVIGSNHQLAFSYLDFGFSASKRIARDIMFDGQYFPQGFRVDSDFDATLWRIAYRFVSGSDEIQGGFLIGLQFASADAKATAAEVIHASQSADFVLPVIGGLLEWRPNSYLGFGGNLTMGSWNWDDVEATFMDLDASARLYVDYFFAGAGYRYLAIDSEDESTPITLDVSFSGPTFFVGASF